MGRRVEEGGHDVPVHEIVRRWSAAQENLLRTWISFDRITIIDNSRSQPFVAAELIAGTRSVHKHAPGWALALLQRAGNAAPLPD